jgi:hypothetical protein
VCGVVCVFLSVCDLETSTVRWSVPKFGHWATEKEIIYCFEFDRMKISLAIQRFIKVPYQTACK